AAAGTAVVHPTLLGLVADHADEPARGRATSLVTTVAYLGFLAGPVYVGRWADATALPTAMLAVAALAAALAVVAVPVLALTAGTARSGGAPTPTSTPTPRSAGLSEKFRPRCRSAPGPFV
ncbi:MAG TPA: hypothetical protein VIL36_05035, partial [Acidimicrobiales bacterium]